MFLTHPFHCPEVLPIGVTEFIFSLLETGREKHCKPSTAALAVVVNVLYNDTSLAVSKKKNQITFEC